MKQQIVGTALSLTLVLILQGCTGFLNEGATRVRISTREGEQVTPFEAIYFRPTSPLQSKVIPQGESFTITMMFGSRGN